MSERSFNLLQVYRDLEPQVFVGVNLSTGRDEPMGLVLHTGKRRFLWTPRHGLRVYREGGSLVMVTREMAEMFINRLSQVADPSEEFLDFLDAAKRELAIADLL